MPLWRSLSLNFIVQRLVFTGGWWILSHTVSAEPLPDNWRERCRQIISGQYLEHYDAKTQAQDQIKMLVQQIGDIEQQLKTTTTRYDALELKLRNMEFDKSQAIALQDLRSKQKYEQELLKSKNDALIVSKKTAENSEKRLERFTALTSIVFKIERKAPAEADPGYGIRLEFRSPCPRHRFVCPLPTADAKALAEISKELESSESCERYSSVLR